MTRKTDTPPTDEGPRCGSCRFWRAFEDEPTIGTCRCSPPTWVLSSEDAEVSGWPTVDADEYACGQFRGKH